LSDVPAITSTEGVCEDDPSITSVLEKIDAAIEKPDIQRDQTHGAWRSVAEGIRKRHVKGRQAFRNRRRLVKRGEFLDDPPELSISAEQAEWESVEKGSKLWEERRTLWWKFEAERMFTWDWAGDLETEQADKDR
jgi:hypothetical protein